MPQATSLALHDFRLDRELSASNTNCRKDRTAVTPRDFPQGLVGRLLFPGDLGYDTGRQVYNAAIDRRPMAIVKCRTIGDIASCVQYAKAQCIPLAVRATGHNVAGFSVCDGGLVVDLSEMQFIMVDAAARR